MAVEPLAALSSHAANIKKEIDAVQRIAEDASTSPAKYDPADSAEPMPDLWKTIEPVFRLHDNVQKWLMENEELFKFPYLSEAVENIGNYMNALVYKFLAVLLEPSLQETRNAVKAARDEAFKAGQLSDIFQDGSTDSNPSHSDIAKDHFSNLLNQPAGLVATVITNWSVRMVVSCWDDHNQNADDMINHILTILHHPAFPSERNDPQRYMFEAVENWWNAHSPSQKDQLRKKLSKESAKFYYDHHSHTITASNFRGPNKRQYKQGYEFPGSRPEIVARPSESITAKAQELIQNVSNTLNDAGKAVINGTVEVINVVGDTTNDVGNFVGKTVDDAGNFIGDTANDVGNFVGQTANKTVNVVGDTVNDVGNFVGQTANETVNVIGNTANDVGNFVGNIMPWNW